VSGRPFRPLPSSGTLGGPIVHLHVTGSTNDRARELAAAGAPHGTVVLAEEQTAGRGRQGRKWTAPRGSAITLSVLIRPPEQRFSEAFSLLPAASALATCEAAEEVAAIECRIKWPNDVLAGGRKLAGILIEARPQEGWAVAGIGLNVNTAESELPPELRGTATSLRIECGTPVDRDGALVALLRRLAARTVPGTESGSREVLAAYRERDALRGKRIAWTAGEERFAGLARGIDDAGRLLVRRDGRDEVALDAGEVHLLPSLEGVNS
jgi:BirA family biotin operon repressor/biotin-[acetyl-CoA-carboxylase] ligase